MQDPVIGRVETLVHVYQTVEGAMVKWTVTMAVMNWIVVSHVHIHGINIARQLC